MIYCFSFLNRYEILINFHCYNLFDKWTELPHALLDFRTLESQKCTLYILGNNIVLLHGNRSPISWPQWYFPVLCMDWLLNKHWVEQEPPWCHKHHCLRIPRIEIHKCKISPPFKMTGLISNLLINNKFYKKLYSWHLVITHGCEKCSKTCIHSSFICILRHIIFQIS